MTIPGGWYDDPWSAAGLRWWDGLQWTPHTAPRPYPVGAYQLPVTPGDLARVERSAGIARVALVIAALLTSAQLVIDPIVFHHVLHDWVHRFHVFNDQLSTDPNSTPQLQLDFSPLLGIDLLQLLLLGPQILFLVWFYRAAQLARRLNIPSRRAPVWAVLGFLVPIVSLWFPYQVGAGLMPPQDPDRRAVGWWWGLYLTQGFLLGPDVIVGYFSVAAAVVIGVFGSILAIVAVVNARTMIAASTRAHRAVLGQ